MTIIVIIILAIIILAIIIVLNIPQKSERLGEKFTGTKHLIYGKLRVLSDKNPTGHTADKETYFSIYEKGIGILQGVKTIEVPWGAIYDINSGNYSNLVNKDKSLIGRAAVGGLLFGEIGAIIGGMSGLQQSQIDIGGDLFLIAFNCDNQKVIFGIQTREVQPFIEQCKLLKNENEVVSIGDTALDEIFLIGDYSAHQIIENEQCELCNTISYNKTKGIYIIDVDGRGANYNLLLNSQQKDELKVLLSKSKEWNEKAFNAKLEAEKNVGATKADISLEYAGTRHFVHDGEISITYVCWFNLYNVAADDLCNIDDYSHIMINTQNVNIVSEDITIPAAIIFIKPTELDNLIALLSNENITSAIQTIEDKSTKIDSILN